MSEVVIQKESTENGDSHRKISESSDTEFDPQYKPIITLPEVKVSTNEEDESEMLKLRAKLYRYDSASDPPEWKERGTGEMKLLRHNENSRMRLVMRRDKTLKVCANHFITPWMELKPSATNEKAFVYHVVADFSDEVPKRECLAIKFATVDNAKLFKDKFEEAKRILLSDCDLYNGVADRQLNEEDTESDGEGSDRDSDKENTDQVAEKLSELSFNKDDSSFLDKSPAKDK